MNLRAEPKFSLGDTVYFMHQNHPCESKVLTLRIEISDWEIKEYEVEYITGGYQKKRETFFLNENSVFSSIAELKESLFKAR